MSRIHIPRLTKLQNPVQGYLSFCFIAFGEGRDDFDIRYIRIPREDGIIRIVAHAAPVMSGGMNGFQHHIRKERNLIPLFQHLDMFPLEKDRIIMITGKVQFVRESPSLNEVSVVVASEVLSIMMDATVNDSAS